MRFALATAMSCGATIAEAGYTAARIYLTKVPFGPITVSST